MKLRNSTAIITLGFLLLGAFVFTRRTIAHDQTVNAGQAASFAVPAQDLVFVGTVTRIYQAPSERSLRNWAVVTRVDRVVSGEFSGKTFAFMIHSPAQMGLRVGRAYTIKAKRSDGGYLVDDTQWLKPVTPRTRKPKSN